MTWYSPKRKRRKTQNGGVETRAQHIARSGLETQRYIAAVDAARKGKKVHIPRTGGKSKFAAGGGSRW